MGPGDPPQGRATGRPAQAAASRSGAVFEYARVSQLWNGWIVVTPSGLRMGISSRHQCGLSSLLAK
ncbi:hypothetical protein C8D88_112242 [Lentzea atacamensis]|uniref:Uncharacterized protein n=1 Tax=Lentzea atacamensis TaxID=531938 RepID=A0A316I701_9PSEU|nr:hypothetical protein [Lentzea atacamensis]PWK82991.1 hypothetical protein C8D88_112242 [Lentzea atacamensis]